MTFRVGQKVVCVDDSPTDKEGGRDLTRGRIYTIRWCGIWGWPGVYRETHCVRLMEILRGPDEWNPRAVDVPFNPKRFRPLVERKTDISIFTKMLTPAQEPACTSS